MSHSITQAILVASVLLFASSTSFAQPSRVAGVQVDANPSDFRGACPATITFTGRILLVGRPGIVRYRWFRSDGGLGPVETMNFQAVGLQQVTTTWTLGRPSSPDRVRWQAIRILAPNAMLSHQAQFRIHCESPQEGGVAPKPDLEVVLRAPRVARAGERPSITVFPRNIGMAVAPGTVGITDPDNGFMIDVILSTDAVAPVGAATFSPNFAEDVMVRGGRISRTSDLAMGAVRSYTVHAGIPADTPSGQYFLCARIDPWNKVTEMHEDNNTACTQINIIGRP